MDLKDKVSDGAAAVVGVCGLDISDTRPPGRLAEGKRHPYPVLVKHLWQEQLLRRLSHMAGDVPRHGALLRRPLSVLSKPHSPWRREYALKEATQSEPSKEWEEAVVRTADMEDILQSRRNKHLDRREARGSCRPAAGGSAHRLRCGAAK